MLRMPSNTSNGSERLKLSNRSSPREPLARQIYRMKKREDLMPVGEHSTDEQLMRLALAEAHTAAQNGEVPVGAVVSLGGHIVGCAGNRTIGDCDPTAHAEIIALRVAAQAVGNHRLTGAVLFVTVEPCAMCAGAMVQARIRASGLRLRRFQSRRRAFVFCDLRSSRAQPSCRGDARRPGGRMWRSLAVVFCAAQVSRR